MLPHGASTVETGLVILLDATDRLDSGEELSPAERDDC